MLEASSASCELAAERLPIRTSELATSTARFEWAKIDLCIIFARHAMKSIR